MTEGLLELAVRGAGAYHAWRATGLKHNYLLSLPPLTKVQPGLRLLPAVGEGNAANVLRAGGQPTRRREAAGPVVARACPYAHGVQQRAVVVGASQWQHRERGRCHAAPASRPGAPRAMISTATSERVPFCHHSILFRCRSHGALWLRSGCAQNLYCRRHWSSSCEGTLARAEHR